MTTDTPKRLQKVGDTLDLKGRYFFLMDTTTERDSNATHVDGDKIEKVDNGYVVYDRGIQVGYYRLVRAWRVDRSD